ncbi:hypothetical protein J2X31_002748 [Flavobacterium arsenatis]|uniref:Uncharacterized protein n=1 Tax=Flavobacterium arsenatis TaxID=1484332 RepID=A0ABU1TS63_9FLAO|nr:hypothetical protein [Flavobacterium arsenatis]
MVFFGFFLDFYRYVAVFIELIFIKSKNNDNNTIDLKFL